VRHAAGCGLGLVLLAAPPAPALPLQEVLKTASPSVAHLSIRDSKGEEEGSGSGFVISEDGKLATNFHVVEDAERIVAVFPEGKEVEVVGVRSFDEESDVAIVQLKPGKYPPLKLSATPAKQGDEIVVIGSPLGLGHAISTGIVSAVREHGTKTAAHKDGVESWGLQITATIASGSSGSPIMNAEGEVVGLAVGQMWGTSIHFGVPVARLSALVPKASGALLPLKTSTRPRSVRTNLLISAGVFGGLALAGWLLSLRHRHREVQPRGWRTLDPPPR
jgi:S1-C subfamily serine protease